MSSEAGRWYTRSGEPRNVMTGQNGRERAVTLRDARKENLVPSVTTIINSMSSPGLDAWKQKMLLEACWENRDAESYSDFASLSRAKAKEASEIPAIQGQKIHGYLEAYYSREPYPAEGSDYIGGVSSLLSMECGAVDWNTERTFATDEYGGCVDLYSDKYIVDFKTKDFSPSDPEPKGYDNHVIQLAAYREGLGLPRAKCANVFVSRDCPGHATIWWWTEDDMQRGWKMFNLLFALWKVTKRWEPKEE